MTLQIVLIAAVFLIMLGTGVWTTKLGRPLNIIAFSLHKISALLTVILLILFVLKHNNTLGFEKPDWILIVITGLSILLGFVSGSLLSFDKLTNTFTKTIHKLVSLLTIIALIFMIYLFNK